MFEMRNFATPMTDVFGKPYDCYFGVTGYPRGHKDWLTGTPGSIFLCSGSYSGPCMFGNPVADRAAVLKEIEESI